MAIPLNFTGEFNYEDKKAYKKALDAASEAMGFESETIQQTWMDAHEIGDLSIKVNVFTSTESEEDFFGYETIIEAIAEFANSGTVRGWMRDDEANAEVYEAQA